MLLAAVTVVLIGLLTRSLALALLAPLLAALSEAAMLGALVWGYQQGHLQGVLPMTSTGSLVVYVPIVAGVIAYALSLDYLVFVLARVQEARRVGRSLDEAMKDGLSRTGPVITTAAGLMTLVFAGFATGSLLLVQQLGFALAAAIVLDATLVRCLLLPAVVSLLARLHPRCRSHGGPISPANSRGSRASPGTVTESGSSSADGMTHLIHDEAALALVGNH